MEEKKRVSFLNGIGLDYDHLILNESQIRLLDYLYQNQEMREDFDYVIRDEVEWKEI